MPVDSNSHSACARQPGIEDHRVRDHERMAQRFLDLGRLVGDAGDSGELAGRQSWSGRDLAHRRRLRAAAKRPTGPDPVDVFGVAISLARQSCTALAPSVIEPPPRVTIRSASAARACSAAAITAERGECAGIASKVPTQRGPSARRTFSISSVSRLSVPLTIRKARVRRVGSLLDDRLGCRPSEHDLVHGAEYDTPFMHACPPRTFLALVVGLAPG